MLETLPGPDMLDVWYSYDNSYWWRQDYYKGTSSGWEQINFALNEEADQIWLRFHFRSDWDCSTGEGAYIDSIIIQGTPEYRPEFTWYPTCPGWDLPVTLSPITPDTGTYAPDSLYAGEPIYLDWACLNDGNITSTNVGVNLYIDGDLEQTFNLPVFAPGTYCGYEDWAFSLDQGPHTIEMRIDEYGNFQEWNEDDNNIELDFYVRPAAITYSGLLQYQDPLPPTLDTLAATGVRITMWDDDFWGDELIAEDYVGFDGSFTLGPLSNADKKGDKLDIFFRIFVENEACYVTQTLGSERFYMESSETIENHASGVFDTTIVMTTEQSGAIYSAEEVRISRDKWLVLAPGYVPDTLQLVVANGQTGYHVGDGRMVLNNHSGSRPWSPDHFEAGAVHHEYGHYLADLFDILYIGDTTQTSFTSYIPSLELVAQESWPEFWTRYCQNTPEDRNLVYGITGVLTDYSWADAENGMSGAQFSAATDLCTATCTNRGEHYIGAMVGALWDVVDEPQDDISTYGVVDSCGGECPMDCNDPDGRGDSLQVSCDLLVQVLLEGEVAGGPPQTLRDFWHAWFHSRPVHPLHTMAMVDIWYEHGVPDTLDCCVGIRGDVNGDGAVQPDIADLVYLVTYLFQDGPPPPCYVAAPYGYLEADVNADGYDGGNPIIDDLVYLVSYMYQDGPDLQPCLQYD